MALSVSMAFKDVLRFLYERAKAQDPALTQEKFARRHQIHRTELSQMLSGSYVPTGKLIGQIFKTEGYRLEDCIELPEMRAERDSHASILEDLLKRNEIVVELLREYMEFLNWKRNRDRIDVATDHHEETRAPPSRPSRKQRRVI